MDRQKVYEFCLESTIPGIHEAIANKSNLEVFKVVVKRAHRDVIAGARFWDMNYVKESEYFKEKIIECFIEYDEDISSQNLIERLRVFNTCNALLGSIQKLVNMTLKYLYVLDSFNYLEDLGISINVEKIHCPIDSVVLEKLKNKTKKNYTPWTKIDSMDEYTMIQNDIKKYVKITNLEFDFDNWESKS